MDEALDGLAGLGAGRAACQDGPVSDRGFTHVALTVTDVEASVAFYGRYASMSVVHRRVDPTTGHTVVWLSDLARPFVVVLIEQPTVTHTLGGFTHLGVACESRARVDELVASARAGGVTVVGPLDEGPPVGYFAFLVDPDGHNLEVSYGQDVGLAVAEAAGPD